MSEEKKNVSEETQAAEKFVKEKLEELKWWDLPENKLKSLLPYFQSENFNMDEFAEKAGNATSNQAND